MTPEAKAFQEKETIKKAAILNNITWRWFTPELISAVYDLIKKNNECPVCLGTGRLETLACDYCGGEGFVYEQNHQRYELNHIKEKQEVTP